ncbi:MAG: pyruvate dehydrogenase (acetyl-transferring) E1 component subunit alpha [Thaumarchaeota archaeon]|nr:pyruvate dehydrogenase (acetyl-transferring) E1 component subunit alpha [Nitrososphaerota archaeon]MCS4539139.1 pyruvate dehydrogenase (acetyl-transferring) E1 component subunit alpha [Nitrososphaerota archaeon]
MEMLSILRADGEYDPKLEPDLSDEDLVKMYRHLILVRKFNERGMALQRQGRIGFFIDSTGQEACQIGAAYALNSNDWVYPTYRDVGVCFLRGVPMKVIFDQLYANAQDYMKGRQLGVHWGYKEKNIVTIGSPIATQLVHAVGTAYAVKYKNHRVVTLTFFGDGATSQGEFHTALNFAGVFKLPIVFFCENNQYAISLPVRRQTASENIAMKAWSYGFEGTQVDGNDILAVYKAAKDTIDKARSGGGPTLIEGVTYRMGGHSTADDPSKYRNQSEVEMWKKRDPILRFRLYLMKKGLLSEQEDRKMQQEMENEVNETAKEAEKVAPPALSTMFSDVYEEMPWHLKEELDDLMKEGT